MATLLSKKLNDQQMVEVEGLLAGGIDSTHIAETIQGDWQIMTDVPLKIVAQTVTAHWRAMHKQQKAEEPTAVPSAAFDPLAEILALAQQQRQRVDQALAKEKEVGIPMDATAKAMKDLSDTLALMQKMKIEHDVAQAKKQGGAGGHSKSLTTRIAEAVNASERVMNRLHG